MKDKKNNILIILVVILIISLVGVILYFVNDKNKLVKKYNDLKTKNETKEQTKNEETKEEPKKEEKYLNLELKKENSLDNAFNFKLGQYSDFASYIISNNNKTVELSYNLKKISDKFSLGLKKEDKIQKSIISFNKDVTDIFVGGIGQDFAGSYVFFLLEDGTLEYINEYNYIVNQELKVNNIDSKVNNIIKFYNVILDDGVDVLAQRQDGKYYYLSNYVKR